ncbi:helix-turn-helix transcriptional regulator [Desulfosporosinus lacus]|uniref:Helix-turn-helix domain-containing protein n=1 Tax=Desulfosporosinus lacus DSM 15449 TaxID=1121420 RepID=A0A1M5WIA0_9FIRM|nr:helix-turn-helix transcriptional regulator [Desulfosporosinus lacus]SHH87225.1 Helix-turn-helix domain-containing protein [Desulfosporosinus lacus DSM 15449]
MTMTNNLKEMREFKGLSQFQLSKRADVNPADISRLENGKIFAYPGWRKKISEALGVTEIEIWPELEGGLHHG